MRFPLHDQALAGVRQAAPKRQNALDIADSARSATSSDAPVHYVQNVRFWMMPQAWSLIAADEREAVGSPVVGAPARSCSGEPCLGS
jgi:hypothetical protein